jgi:hypothetical protein
MEPRRAAVVADTVLAVAALVLAGNALAACGGGSPPAARGSVVGVNPGGPMSTSPPPAGASSGGAVFKGTLSLNGEVGVSGPFTDTSETWSGNCSNWAATSRAGTGPFITPGPGGPQGAVVGGVEVGMAFTFPRYHGPGIYTADASTTGLDAGGRDYGGPSRYTLDVHSDGSGSLTFTSMSDRLDPSQVISGRDTWTCIP